MLPTDRHGEKRRGLLIALEGIDGTGKSTQLQLLAEALRAMGHAVTVTREPTDGPHGRRLRELFSRRHTISPGAELELFQADRRQHVAQVIEPALKRGDIVVTDRYFLSTAAYQGTHGPAAEEILQANEAFAPRPDLALVLVLDPGRAIHRIRTLRNQELNDFEQEAGLRRVAAIFAGLDRDYIRRVDGAGPVAEVHRQIMARVEGLVRDRGPGTGRRGLNS